jgi:glycosyltransferase involved in cell wall biosynthesis
VIGWGLGAPQAHYPLAGFFNRSRDRFLCRFDALISYSTTGMDQFAAAGFPRERIYMAPNAAAPRPTQPPPERPAAYANGRPTVLYVGRLQARKRIDSLLRACAALPEAIQPRLVIAGEGPARGDLVELAAGLYPTAIFTGDRRGQELDALYRAADLFVLPGTGGLAVQQALAHALPVLVAEADGTQTNLVSAANGWLVPPGDESALRAGLTEALADPARLRQMGAESYRIAVEEVNLERMTAVFVDVVRAVAKAGHAGSLNR